MGVQKLSCDFASGDLLLASADSRPHAPHQSVDDDADEEDEEDEDEEEDEEEDEPAPPPRKKGRPRSATPAHGEAAKKRRQRLSAKVKELRRESGYLLKSHQGLLHRR